VFINRNSDNNHDSEEYSVISMDDRKRNPNPLVDESIQTCEKKGMEKLEERDKKDIRKVIT
jgi:hypothetical protein